MGSILTALEGLWWALVASALAGLGLGWLWQRRPWRRQDAHLIHVDQVYPDARRAAEADQLDELERLGTEPWKPRKAATPPES